MSPSEVSKNENLELEFQPNYALGFRTTPSMVFVDHCQIAYLIGRQLTFFNYETQQHSFTRFHTENIVIDMTSFCVTRSQKMIALCERFEDNTHQTTIYNLLSHMKIRTLEMKYLGKWPVVTMAFSNDNKFLITITQTRPESSDCTVTDCTLYLWQVDKGWLLGMENIPFRAATVSFCPVSSSNFACSGSIHSFGFKLFSYHDKNITTVDPLHKHREAMNENVTSHLWLKKQKVVIGTNQGNLLFITGTERIVYIREALNGQSISVLSKLSRGFLCLGASGYVCIFDESVDSDSGFHKYRTFRHNSHHRILACCISPKENAAIISFTDNSMALFALDNIDIIPDNAESEMCFVNLSNGFHFDFVTSISVGIQRPLIATTSMDGTVHVWNSNSKRLEVLSRFEEEVSCVSMHPSGLRLIIATRTRLLLLHLLADSTLTYAELPVKFCQEVKFCNGGQFLAAATHSRVVLYRTYDLHYIGSLPGTSSMIQALAWSVDDQYIACSEASGNVLCYEMSSDADNMKPFHTKNHGNACATCIRFDSTSSSIISVITSRGSADGKILEGETWIDVTEFSGTSTCVPLGCVKIQRDNLIHCNTIVFASLYTTIFVGLPSGAILVYRYPLRTDSKPVHRLEMHQSPISFLQLSYDERFLISISDDHVMFSTEVSGRCGESVLVFPEYNPAPFEEVQLTLRSSMEELNLKWLELNAEMRSLHKKFSDDMESLKEQHALKVKNAVGGLEDEMDVLNSECSQLLATRSRLVDSIKETKADMEAEHVRSAENLSLHYAEKSRENLRILNDLRTNRDDMIVRHEQYIHQLTLDNTQERTELENKLRSLSNDLLMEENKIIEKHKNSKIELENLIDSTIEEYEEKIEHMENLQTTLLKKKTEEQTQNSVQILAQKHICEQLEKETRQLRTAQDADIQDFLEKDERIERRLKESQICRKEIEVREETISTGLRKISSLEKQLAELEKLKYVLGFKLGELHKEVSPKDEQLLKLRANVQDLKCELEKIECEKQNLLKAQENQNEKLKAANTDLHLYEQKLKAKLLEIQLLSNELKSMLQDSTSSQTSLSLIHRLKSIIETSSSPKRASQRLNVDFTTTSELESERQRELLESKITTVSKQNSRREDIVLFDIRRKTAENALLLQDVNDLRREIKTLETKTHTLERNLTELHQTNVHQFKPVHSTAAHTEQKAISNSAILSELLGQVETNNKEIRRQRSDIESLKEHINQLLKMVENEHRA